MSVRIVWSIPKVVLLSLYPTGSEPAVPRGTDLLLRKERRGDPSDPPYGGSHPRGSRGGVPRALRPGSGIRGSREALWDPLGTLRDPWSPGPPRATAGPRREGLM